MRMATYMKITSKELADDVISYLLESTNFADAVCDGCDDAGSYYESDTGYSSCSVDGDFTDPSCRNSEYAILLMEDVFRTAERLCRSR